jgi:hypothetical protein
MRTKTLILAAWSLLGIVGCNEKRVQPEEIPIERPADPLAPVKAQLESYAKGQPMTSEASDFPRMVENVKAVSPEKAAILEKGFAELLKAKPNERPAIARNLLSKL